VAGATYEDQKTYDWSVSENSLPIQWPFVLEKLPSVQEFPDEYIPDDPKRDFKAFFLEDVWDITDELRLTLGGRYDHYSDFGGHFSPRIGLTWEYMKGYDIKLLYGHAFRAPNFNEIIFSTPGSELDPETVDTYEVSLGADFNSSFSARATFYHREEEDIIGWISTVPGTANTANLGRSRDQGIELEMRYDFGRRTYIAGNYNYQNWKTGNKRKSHKGRIMANIRISSYLNFYADSVFWSRIERDIGDTRDDVSGGGLVNVTLIAKKFLKGVEGLEFRTSVYNLLDKDYKIPTPPQIPNDWPQPGINYLLEVQYKF
jgi:iron complex outermembrane receptor protein